MATNEDLYELPDDRAALLLRDAMDRTTADLPPLPDLVGPARAQGRRRKARVRVAIGGGALAVAALALAGAVAPPGGGGGPQAGGAANVAAPPSSSAPPPPVHLEPTPGQSSMADLPAAERIRQEDFQNRAVGVLQGLLPPSVGTVRRTDLSVRLYQGSKDDKAFVIIFSVRPAEPADTGSPCHEARGEVCARATLPGGIEAAAATAPVNDGNVTETRLSFRYGKSKVSLVVSPHDASNTSAPVTNDQLLHLAKSPAFLDLVKSADAEPVEKQQQTIPGG
ncbi:hypothetical protein [Streptomyces subrutilus]|uniref:Uncharacterized protein n=1 Tax=Streptomyces subrutilus TaxID=36818 RepID=A0A1E5PU46_9ACTN|nr:hypothetical protein [Streptomyces subrutilus]OEJ33106.1 hypothetical protein BGK67_18865 [Streptomyces subrutilus]